MKSLPLIPSFLVLFFVVLMTSLGFWQLNRADQKTQMLSLLSDENITKIEKKSQIASLPRYSHVVLKGYFLSSTQLLLDNQIHEKAIGYHVFTPFKLDNLNMIIMVNRGWLAKHGYASELIEIDEKAIELRGRLNEAPKVGVQLGEISLTLDSTSQVITYYDSPKIKAYLQEKLCDRLDCVVSERILWLSNEQQGGFLRDWKPINMPPSKHIAYAVQWFSMTLVLIVIFMYWLTKQRNDEAT